MDVREHEVKSTAGNQKVSQQVDGILRVLNPKGRYQALHVLVLLLSIIAAGLQLFSNVFVVKAVPHRCAGPPQEVNLTQLFGFTGNLTVVQEKCRLIVKDNSSVLDSTTCLYGNEYDLPIDASVKSQFDLVCDMDWLARLTQTFVILGQGIGAAFTTFLSDKFGRKTVIVASNFGLLLCGIGAAYAPTAIVFIGFKFVIGVFQQGVVSVTTPYFLELFPTEHRDLQAWLVGSTWGLGVMLLSPIAFIFKNSTWRALQTAISLISLLAIIQLWYMDESLRWLLANGKNKEAKKVIKRIARVNNRKEDDIDEFLAQAGFLQLGDNEKALSATKDSELLGSTRPLSLLDIFKIPRLLLNSVCLWFCWFTAALSFFTIYMTATSLSGDPYLNFGLTAVMELPSNVFFFFYLNRLGRKRCMQVMYGVVGSGVLLAGISKKIEESNSDFSVLTLLASLFAMCGASGCFGIVFSFTPEMFPTNLRSQAVGFSSMMGRLGGMLGPFAGLLAEQAVWSPGVVIAICAGIVCLLALVLPETSTRELPQTLPELQAWYKNKKQVSSSDCQKGSGCA